MQHVFCGAQINAASTQAITLVALLAGAQCFCTCVRHLPDCPCHLLHLSFFAKEKDITGTQNHQSHIVSMSSAKSLLAPTTAIFPDLIFASIRVEACLMWYKGTVLTSILTPAIKNWASCSFCVMQCTLLWSKVPEKLIPLTVRDLKYATAQHSTAQHSAAQLRFTIQDNSLNPARCTLLTHDYQHLKHSKHL